MLITDSKQKITRNFIASEFACPCCGKVLIETDLVELIQRIRDKLKVPLLIYSGYRCENHNKEIGGSPKSQHLLGIASDISLRAFGKTIKHLFLACEEELKDKGGLGYYPIRGFVHVDIREKMARWYEIKKGVYSPLTKEKRKLFGLGG